MLTALLLAGLLVSPHAHDRVIVKRVGQSARAEAVQVPESVKGAIDRLSREPGVLYVEPDYYVYADVVITEPYWSQQWGPARVGLPQALDHATGAGIVVGIVDTGVNYNAYEFTSVPAIYTNPGEIPGNGVDDDANGFIDDVRGWDFYWGDNDPMDELGHGTHVAGTAAAPLGNSGIAGMAPAAKILPLRFLGPCGSGLTSDAISAIDYARMLMQEYGLHLVLNNSWGGTGFSQGLQDSISAFVAAGGIFVAAAGNNAQDLDANCDRYPACLSDVITVAASEQVGDARPAFSNYGATRVDLTAPGLFIVSTYLCDKARVQCYTNLSGTSMATPHVTGAVALLLELQPFLTNEQVRTRLRATCEPLANWTSVVACGGILDAEALVTIPTPSAHGQGWRKKRMVHP